VTVLEAASGEEALRAVQRVLPDAILLDMKMPGMGGPATLFALQSDSHTAHIPVVFVTANPEPVDVQQLRAQGAVGVLTKPFRPAHLVAELARMLGWP
jgi:CheY-like chemotaxis protein